MIAGIAPCCCGPTTCAKRKCATDYPVGNHRRDEWDTKKATLGADEILVYFDYVHAPKYTEISYCAFVLARDVKKELEGHSFALALAQHEDEDDVHCTGAFSVWRKTLETTGPVGVSNPGINPAFFGGDCFLNRQHDDCDDMAGTYGIQWTPTGELYLQVRQIEEYVPTGICAPPELTFDELYIPPSWDFEIMSAASQTDCALVPEVSDRVMAISGKSAQPWRGVVGPFADGTYTVPVASCIESTTGGKYYFDPADMPDFAGIGGGVATLPVVGETYSATDVDGPFAGIPFSFTVASITPSSTNDCGPGGAPVWEWFDTAFSIAFVSSDYGCIPLVDLSKQTFWPSDGVLFIPPKENGYFGIRDVPFSNAVHYSKIGAPSLSDENTCNELPCEYGNFMWEYSRDRIGGTRKFRAFQDGAEISQASVLTSPHDHAQRLVSPDLMLGEPLVADPITAAPDGKYCLIDYYLNDGSPESQCASVVSAKPEPFSNVNVIEPMTGSAGLALSMCIYVPTAVPTYYNYIITPCTGDSGLTYRRKSLTSGITGTISIDALADFPDPQSKCYTVADDEDTSPAATLEAHSTATDCATEPCIPLTYKAEKCDDPMAVPYQFDSWVVIPADETMKFSTAPSGANTTDVYKINTDTGPAGGHVLSSADWTLTACPVAPTEDYCVEFTGGGSLFFDHLTNPNPLPVVGKWYQYDGGTIGCVQVTALTATATNDCMGGGMAPEWLPTDNTPYDYPSCAPCDLGITIGIDSYNLDTNGFTAPTAGQYIVIGGICQQVDAVIACDAGYGAATQESEPSASPTCT